MVHAAKKVATFILGEGCNLNCSYCLMEEAKDGETEEIDLDFAKQGMDDFFDGRPDIFGFGNTKIRFYSMGEPTMQMPLMKELTAYARSKIGDSLHVELQTNGVFSPEIADWIAENVAVTWVSLDGPADVQDRLRQTRNGKSVREIVERNIQRLLEEPNIAVGVRPTITSANNGRQQEMIRYFDSLGIKNVWTHHAFVPIGENNDVLNSPVAGVSLMEYAKNYVEAYKVAEKLGLFYGSFLAVNFDESCRHACRACLPMPHFTLDGAVSSCDMAYSRDTKFEELIFGEWKPETKEIAYFPERIAKLRARTVESIPECNECDVASNCAGGCLGEAYYETGSMNGIRPDHCEAVKYLAKHLPRNEGRFPLHHP
jgi:uncharacterized protein